MPQIASFPPQMICITMQYFFLASGLSLLNPRLSICICSAFTQQKWLCDSEAQSLYPECDALFYLIAAGNGVFTSETCCGGHLIHIWIRSELGRQGWFKLLWEKGFVLNSKMKITAFTCCLGAPVNPWSSRSTSD